MNTLKIEIPDGYMIDYFDTAKGEIKFKEKPKNVMERIKTVADVLADNGMTRSELDDKYSWLPDDEYAYVILKMLAKSLNEGWTPDWSNDRQYKYYPWFGMGGSSGFRFGGCVYWDSVSGVGSRLCFKSCELAEHAGNTFTEVYKQFMTIPK